MLSNEVKNLLNAVIELYSTSSLSQEIIDSGVEKLKEVKELLLSQDIGEEILYKVMILHPYTYTEYVNSTTMNSTTGRIEETPYNYKTSDYLDIENAKYISIHENTSYHICNFYDADKNFIIGYNQNQYTKGTQLAIPENAKYAIVCSTSGGVLPIVYIYTTTKPSKKIFEHESDMEYNVLNVNAMMDLDCKTGDVVRTECYEENGDLGNAVYDIITEAEYVHLMKKSAFISGIDTQVDGYGDHILNNGLVARLRIDGNDMRPEQWGAKGDGVTNDVLPFVHMFGKVSSGVITFRDGATYLLGLIGGTIDKPTDNPYRTFGCGSLLGGQWFSKPILIGANNLVLNGNNCLITIPDNTFGNCGMGILNFSGHLKNVEIYGFNFDGKGRTINYPNKNSNHILFYAPIGINTNSETIMSLHPIGAEGALGGTIENLSIHDNYFYDAGAMFRTAGDWGGDHILIINPDAVDGIEIVNNRFEAWGRWVFAIDLGGKGECFHNIKFNHNTCLGANAYLTSDTEGNFEFLLKAPEEDFKRVTPNLTDAGVDYKVDQWRWRALGLIDFEAKKCFDNVEFKDNYIIGTAGWAINGNSRISQNFLIKNNYWNHIGGGYPYFFELYSGMGKDIVVEDNQFPGRAGFKCGYFSHNLTFRRNKGGIGLRTFGIAGNITLEDNKSYVENGYKGIIWSHESNNYEADPLYTYDKVKEIGVHITVKNNEAGLHCKFSDPTNLSLNDFFTFDMEMPSTQTAKIHDYNHLIEFDPTDIDFVNQAIMFYGSRFTKPFEHSIMCGNLAYYKKGEVIAVNCQNWGVVGGDLYKNKLIENFSIYNGCNWRCYADRNGYSNISIVCEEEGYLAGGCEYGFRENSTHISYIINNNLKLQDTAFVNTDDNLYYVTGSAKLSEVPTHTEGTQEYTDVDGNTITLHYIGKVLKAKVICE